MASTLKFSLPQLALLDWLTEAGKGRRLMQGSNHGNYLFEVVDQPGGKPTLKRVLPSDHSDSAHPDKIAERALIRRLGGRDKVDTNAMYRAGFFDLYHLMGQQDVNRDRGMEAFRRFAERFDSPYMGANATTYVVNDAGFDYMAGPGGDLLESLRAQADAAKAAVTRTVLIGRQATIRGKVPGDLAALVPAGMTFPIPSRKVTIPFALATVVKETATRLYIEDLQVLSGQPHYFASNPVGGYEPNQYISPGDVMVDRPAPGLVERLVAIEADYAADLDTLTEDLVRKLLPIASEMYSRLLQKDSEREDLLREAITEARDGDVPGDPSPRR